MQYFRAMCERVISHAGREKLNASGIMLRHETLPGSELELFRIRN